MKPGIFVEYYPYPSIQLHKAEGIKPQEGALVEPASVAIHGSRIAQINVGDTVLIYGAGPIGLFRVQACKLQGAGKIIVSEPSELRQGVAKNLGADLVVNPEKENVMERVMEETNGLGADVVFEDVGLPKLQVEAINAARPRGTVVLTGFTTEEATLNLTRRVTLKELQVRGSCGYSGWPNRPHDYRVAIDLIRSGRLRTKPVVTHEFQFGQWKKAFEQSENPREAIKVRIKIG